MASYSLKQVVKETVGESSFDESLWDSCEVFELINDLQEALRVYEALKDHKRKQEGELQRLKKELQRKHEEELQQQKEEFQRQKEDIYAECQTLKGTETVVLSISNAAGNPITRHEYREKVVAEKLASGGYVSHQMFVEFVKGARSMCKVDENGNCIHAYESKRKEKILSAIQKVEEIIKASVLYTLLEDRECTSSCDADQVEVELPQSAVACELLKKALAMLRHKMELPRDTPRNIFVSHQFQILAAASSRDFHIINPHSTRLERSEQQPTSKRAKSETMKVDFTVDILCWFKHSDETLGACALAAAEYKPNNQKDPTRDIQADMKLTNIQHLHQKPCMFINIAGGQKVSEWVISVYGISESLPTRESTGSRYEKSELFSGRGVNAIVRVAAGLLASSSYFPKKLGDFGKRLGPAVGYHKKDGDDIGVIFKAYDNPQIRPNIKWTRRLLDPYAELWKSMDDDDTNHPIFIVKMGYVKSNWKESVTFQSFIDILEKLKTLHDHDCVHGDIRLSNLLSSGYIVDFDFVGLEQYPDGLQILNTDGERHEDVKRRIINESIGCLKPNAAHDLYSMAVVMRLFTAKSEIGQTCWQSASCLVQSGNLIEAVEDLRKNACEQIKLTNEIPLWGNPCSYQQMA